MKDEKSFRRFYLSSFTLHEFCFISEKGVDILAWLHHLPPNGLRSERKSSCTKASLGCCLIVVGRAATVSYQSPIRGQSSWSVNWQRPMVLHSIRFWRSLIIVAKSGRPVRLSRQSAQISYRVSTIQPITGSLVAA